MKLFEYDHLPAHLQEVSKPFHDLALKMGGEFITGSQHELAITLLLQAKDAAVRAVLHPGI